MTGNLAAPSYAGVLLYLNESADLGFVSDFASVKIDEPGEPDISAKFHVVRN
jgi:hypothetical protein